MKPILYVNVPWMKFYQGASEADKPKGGFKFIREHPFDDHAQFNFKKYKEKYYGHFPGGKNPDLKKLGGSRHEKSVDDVTVVWTATHPKKGGRFIVGWYQNARVWRTRQKPDENLAGQRTTPELRDICTYSVEAPTTSEPIAQNNREPLTKYGLPQKQRLPRIFWYGEPAVNECVLKMIDGGGPPLPAPTDSGAYIETGEKESLTKHRIGQEKIRQDALKRYGNQCCLCKIDDPSLLVAGHIEGWAKGEDSRSDPENVILMCALHDSLFGKGFLTLNASTYQIRISSKLSEEAKQQVKSMTLQFRPPNTGSPANKYLAWHRKNVYQE